MKLTLLLLAPLAGIVLASQVVGNPRRSPR